MKLETAFQLHLANMDLDVARAVIEAHITTLDPITSTTAGQYIKRAVGELTLHQLRAYREQAGLPFINPNEIAERRAGLGHEAPGFPIKHHLERFLRRSAELKFNAWQLARSALLYWVVRRYQKTEGQEQVAYTRTLAILIAITKPINFQEGAIRAEVSSTLADGKFILNLIDLIEAPTKEETREFSVSTRATSITADQWDVLASELDERGDRGRQSKLLFQSCLMTGARASEWVGAVLRAVTPADYEGLPTIAALMALDVPTGKLKALVAPIIRTFLIVDESALQIIEEHLDNIRNRSRRNSLDPVRTWLGDCSTLIRQVAEEFLPDLSDKITTRTARSQARAEFVFSFDDYISAAALGHGPRVGRRHYGSRHHATGAHPGVVPSAEILRRGAAMRQERQASAVRQSWLDAPRSDESGEALSGPSR